MIDRLRGFSLLEVLTTLVVAAIAVSMAVPRLDALLRRERVRAALNHLAGDLEFTRMAAVRSGEGAVLRFVRDPRCPARGGAGYCVALRGTRAVLRCSPRPQGLPACYEVNADSIAYNSRGLLAPFNNRTVRVVQGSARDSLTVSVIGRIYRRF
ncbi:MAG: Tfp pilus assembly protein FimT/FimU [Longimicrobiaceae bacterium]